MSTTTQATPKTIELNGVLDRYELPQRTTAMLNNESLRQIGAALQAIKTCNDLLASRESDAGEGLPTLCGQTAHGLMAAITSCTLLIENHLSGSDADGALVLKDDAAREIDAAGFRLWHRNYTAQGGTK